MKKILFVLIGFITLSCSNDSDENSNSTNLIINGNSYTVVNATAVDNYRFSSDTHAEYDFILTDGTITVDAEPGSYFAPYVTDGSFSITLDMMGNNPEFAPGTYTFDAMGIFSPQPNTNFFYNLGIGLDANDNGVIGEAGEPYYTATSGTVVVTGTAPNFNLDFDVTLSNGQNFRYYYDGGFDPYNNRND
jgi:hypothetical protein